MTLDELLHEAFRPEEPDDLLVPTYSEIVALINLFIEDLE